MKKILLGTTGLVGAAFMFAGVAVAETPKVTVGGFADFQAGYISDDSDSNERSHGFRNDTEVIINVDGKSDMGLEYGAEIALEADVSGDTDNEGLNASRTFIYTGGQWGRIEWGSNVGAEQALKVDASNFAAATGGIDGDWYRFALSDGNASTTGAIIRPRLTMAHGGLVGGGNGFTAEDTINATKITYYTPRYAGFQAGVSYTPDATVRGQGVVSTGSTAGSANLLSENGNGYENVWSGGLHWEGNFEQFGLALGATGELGDSKNGGVNGSTEDLRSWQAGGNVTVAGFILGGSYGSFQDTANLDADYWTAGVGYDFGAFGSSVTYLDSTSDLADFQNIVVGVDYKLAPGFTPYVEASFFDADPQAAGVADNNGTVVLVGTQLAF